jgi:hypothetical protein
MANYRLFLSPYGLCDNRYFEDFGEIYFSRDDLIASAIQEIWTGYTVKYCVDDFELKDFPHDWIDKVLCILRNTEQLLEMLNECIENENLKLMIHYNGCKRQIEIHNNDSIVMRISGKPSVFEIYKLIYQHVIDKLIHCFDNPGDCQSSGLSECQNKCPSLSWILRKYLSSSGIENIYDTSPIFNTDLAVFQDKEKMYTVEKIFKPYDQQLYNKPRGAVINDKEEIHDPYFRIYSEYDYSNSRYLGNASTGVTVIISDVPAGNQVVFQQRNLETGSLNEQYFRVDYGGELSTSYGPEHKPKSETKVRTLRFKRLPGIIFTCLDLDFSNGIEYYLNYREKKKQNKQSKEVVERLNKNLRHLFDKYSDKIKKLDNSTYLQTADAYLVNDDEGEPDENL